jgi:glycosyltransferase involved in cell wall biosynthesis
MENLRLGVVVDGHAGFIGDLLTDWKSRYETNVYHFHYMKLPFLQERVNRWRLKLSLKNFCNKNDIIFFEWAGPLLVSTSELFINVPIIVRLHSYELYQYAEHIKWDSINKVILVSIAMQRKFNAKFPSHADNTRVLSHGKLPDKFYPVKKTFGCNLGMLGNVTPIKRVYETILTLYGLKERGYLANLHIGGEPREGQFDQRYFSSIKRAVNKLGLENQVIFHGKVTAPATWLQNIDIYISNSYWEGQQNALIEAMASGCFCLSHFWDGSEEILPVNYLFRNDEELQAKIIDYINLTEECKQKHQRRMREIFDAKFDFNITKLEFRRLFEEVYFDARDKK